MKNNWKHHVGILVCMFVPYFSGLMVGWMMHLDLHLWIQIPLSVAGGLAAAVGVCCVERMTIKHEVVKWLEIIDGYEKLIEVYRLKCGAAEAKLMKMKERDRRVFERSEERWAERRLQEGAGDDELHG